MSDKYTELATESGHGLGEWGHVSRPEMVGKAIAHYERQRDAAIAALGDLHRDACTVWQMYGPYARTGKREV